MQTFLPYDSFVESAKVLDNKRLGKQRVETYQILNILIGNNPNARWRNHPAVLMWKGYEKALCNYGCIICQEWINRGFKDTLKFKIWEMWAEQYYPYEVTNPWWLGRQEFHISHQSNLLRKDEAHYRKFFCNTPNNLPYFWPTHYLRDQQNSL